MKIKSKYILALWEIMFIITIIMFGILIGSPIKNNAQVPQLIISIMGIIFCVIKLVKKEKILTQKIDYIVLVLCISPIIPILAKTYTSLYDTILYALKYITAFLIYIIVKDLCKRDNRIIKYIINITILISVLWVIVGIDKLSTNVFNDVLQKLNTLNLAQDEIRMTSLYSYGNTFGAMMAFSIFLLLGQKLQQKGNILNIIYSSLLFLLLTGLVLSYSRIMYILFILLMILYIVLLKETKEKVSCIKSIFVNGILAIIYSTIFMNLLNNGNYVFIWMGIIIGTIIAGIIEAIIRKIHIKKISSNKLKILILISSVSMVIIGIIAISATEKLVIFQGNNAETKIEKHLYNVNSNTDYKFVFNLNSYSEIENNFKICIVEKNKYFDDIKETIQDINNDETSKEITITTDKDTTEIYIIFEAKEVNENTKLEIKKIQINGKEFKNYKYLPNDLMNKLKNINLKTKSAWERFVFIKDAGKLIKNNWLFGIGGDGWQYRQGEVQEYNNYVREVHSYPTQIFLEYGILAIISYLIILLYLLIKSIKFLKNNIDYEFLSIVISLLVIVLHSLLDFDMSFLIVLILFFLYMGIIVSKFKTEKKESTQKRNLQIIVPSVISIIIISISIILNAKICYITLVIDKKIAKTRTYEEKYNLLEQETKLLPVYRGTYIDRITFLKLHKEKTLELIEIYNNNIIKDLKYLIKYEKYNNQIEMYNELAMSSIENMNIKSKDEMIKNVQYAYSLIVDNPIQKKYNIQEQIKRVRYIYTISVSLYKKSEEMNDFNLKLLSQKFANINIKKFDETIQIISDYNKCRYPKDRVSLYKEAIEEYCNKSKEIIKNINH